MQTLVTKKLRTENSSSSGQTPYHHIKATQLVKPHTNSPVAKSTTHWNTNRPKIKHFPGNVFEKRRTSKWFHILKVLELAELIKNNSENNGYKTECTFNAESMLLVSRLQM